MDLIASSRRLARHVERLSFAEPVHYVYNPLAYAREPHERYLERYGTPKKRALLLGMNPGPFGMAQTGVPFGDVAMVRDFLGITGKVKKPKREHEKRPVLGFDCPRSEVSGTRLWGWARDRFKTADAFFRRFFVYNYCPLCFMEDSGRNRTPDKLPKEEQSALYEACDRALREAVAHLEPEWVIGVGAFAKQRAAKVFAGEPLRIGSILHPSPASPKANRGWAKAVNVELEELGF